MKYSCDVSLRNNGFVYSFSLQGSEKGTHETPVAAKVELLDRLQKDVDKAQGLLDTARLTLEAARMLCA